jgi:hypothetical protein
MSLAYTLPLLSEIESEEHTTIILARRHTFWYADKQNYCEMPSESVEAEGKV